LALLIVGVIIIFGLYLRNESIHGTRVMHPLRADAREYFMYAYNLRHRSVYSREVGKLENIESKVTPDAVRSPGYPLFLALFVDGLPNKRMINNILFVQMIISTLTIFVAFLFFKSFLSKFWGITASLLVAISPHLIVANSYLLTETLFCFLIALMCWQISMFVKKPSTSRIIIIGCVLGITSLVRPSLQYFPIVMAIYLILHYGRKKGIYYFFLMLLGFALTYSPWVIRNIMTLKITADKRLAINFLHHGMYPDFTFDEVPTSYGYPYRHDPRYQDIGKNMPSVLEEIARRFQTEPLKYLKWYILKKPIAFWSWNMVQGQGDAFVYPVSTSPYFSNKLFQYTHYLMRVLHPYLVFLCFLGGLFVWLPLSIINMPEKSIYVARFASIFLIYFTIIHMIGVPFPRYSVPLRPFLYGVALLPFHLVLVFVKNYRDSH